jgi:Cu2+-exporting ATPase
MGNVQRVHQIHGRLRLKITALRNVPDLGETLRSHLLNHTGVTQIRVNPLAHSLIIHHEPQHLTGEQLLEQVQQFLEASSIHGQLSPAGSPVATPTSLDSGAIQPFTPDPLDVQFLQRLAVPTFGLSLALLMTTALELPISPVILLGITLTAAIPLLSRTWQDLNQGRIDEEILESIWTIFYGLTGDFVAPNLDLILAEVADLLQESTNPEQTPPAAPTLPEMQWVQILQAGQTHTIPVADLQMGDQILLQAGDRCPADGLILEGEAWLDFSTLTGEPAPLPRGAGKHILAGCTVMDGQLLIAVEALQEQTQYAQELLLAESAPLQQTQISNYAKAVGQTLIFPTLGVSGGLFLLTHNLERALAPLQLDLITGIRLSAPTAILSMMKYAQQQHISVRSGRVFETLVQADAVVFARTGTLTERDLSVMTIDVFNSVALPGEVELEPTHRLIALAAAAEQCEQEWQHPVGHAIVEYAQKLGLTIPPSQACYLKTGHGLGVSAQVNGQQIILGSRNYLKQAGVTFPDAIDHLSGIQDGQHCGYWYVYMAVEQQLVGQLICCAKIRPESQSVVTQLQQRGLKVYMVTGGDPGMARAIASQIGLAPDAVLAELSSQDKKAFVCRLQAEGHTVVYMGEGMDDYPALRYANVAVGTDQSCTAVQETADLQLPYGDLTALLTAFALADEAIAIVQQNIALITLPHLSATTLGVLLVLDPVWVVIINNAANLLALVNALRPFWSVAPKRPYSSKTSIRSAIAPLAP